MADAQPNDAAGHRSRLRKRLLESGGDALADYELIEYLLMLAIPRRDTKPLAKSLLREFGGFGGLLSADAEALMRVDGVGETVAAAIRIAQATALRLLRSNIDEQPVLASWQALLDYLRADMAYIGIERVRALHLNAKNMLIRDEVVSEGSIDQAAVHVREVIRRAIDLGSSALILVHNHPSGDPAPSRADITLTRDIIDAGKRLNIAIHDHVIIASSGHSSMRALGLI
jgi:DNA repair protein RadC